MSIGENIKKIRKNAGLTQVELAEKLGVTQVAIANYERNFRKPDVETIPKIAKILGVSIEAIYEGRINGKIPAQPSLHKRKRTAKIQEELEKLSVNEQRVVLKQIQLLAQQNSR